MRTHADWSTAAFDHPPAAPAVGPFPRREFLRAVAETGCEDVLLVESETALLVLACEEAGTIRFAGDPDLTDYHVPLGTGVEDLIAEVVSTASPGARFDLDSLPAEAAVPVAEGFHRAGVAVEPQLHAVSAVLDLPATLEEYLDRIGKKQRHELRRKRRRYEETIGPVVHETHRGSGWAFGELVRLHRSSIGTKGTFMTDEHVELFRRLAESPGWRIDVLRVEGTDRAAGCLFSYSDGEGMYVYNSAYDPELSAGSPGLAVVAATIAGAISEGLTLFDFLKGTEVYKFRLGARERPLYRISAAGQGA